jgi:hypothetical protein
MSQLSTYLKRIQHFGRINRFNAVYVAPPSPVYLPAPRRPYTIEVRTPPTGDRWVWPTSYVDASSAWGNETKAYDKNTSTSAGTQTQYATLELDLADAVTCDKVSVYANKAQFSPAYSDPDVKIEVYYGAAWHTLFDGVITNMAWVEKTISPSQSVSKARISGNDALTGMAPTVALELYEFKFHEANIPGELEAYLENAFGVKLQLSAGAAEDITFSLPVGDSKLTYLADRTHDFWVRDSNGDVLASGALDIDEADSNTMTKPFTLSGFMAQLKREYVSAYPNTYESVSVTMANLLDFQVSGTPIRMGTCEYTAADYFEITTPCSLFDALTKLWEQWNKDGYLEVDKARYLNWRIVGAYDGQQIRRGKNLVSIKPKTDYQNQANKIYARGQDASGNVIVLSDLGGYGYDYVSDATSIAAYGTLVDTIIDTSIASAAWLYVWALNELAARKNPAVSYQLEIVNLHYETGYEFNKLVFDEYYRLIDESLGINVETNIVGITYNDLANPLDVSVELSSKTKRLTDTIVELQKRM